MLELSTLLFGTAFFGGNLAGAAAGGVLGNLTYAGTCQAFCRVRDQVFKVSPQNHDLQKAFLKAIGDGVQTTTQHHWFRLSLPECQQVKQWKQTVLETLTHLNKEVNEGGFSWNVTEDMGMLLSATYEELNHGDIEKISLALQGFKTQVEEQFFQLDALPTDFQQGFRCDWLASVYLHLAEAIKSDRRLADMFSMTVTLDIQDRVQNLEHLLQDWVSRFDAPQDFLGIIQPDVQFDIEGLKADIQSFSQEVRQAFDHAEEAAKQRQREVLGAIANQTQPLTAIAIELDQSRPKVEYWQGRQDELAMLKSWLGKANLIGLSGLGGYGKSALADRLYTELTSHAPPNLTSFQQGVWVTLSQPYGFSEFGRWLLDKLGLCIDEQASDEMLIDALVNRLSETSTLVVLDNLETLLQQDGSWCVPSYEKFLLKWLEHGRSSLVLTTSREYPQVFGNHLYWFQLKGLTASEGEQLLRARQIQGTALELQEFVMLADGHPLLLNLAAGLLVDRFGVQPNINRKDAELDLFKVLGLHHGDPEASVEKLFMASLSRLDPLWQDLLSNLTVYRLPFDVSAALAQQPEGMNALSEMDLRQLVQRSLLQEDEHRALDGTRRFKFQPLILKFAQRDARDLVKAHQKAVAYYWKQRQPKLIATGEKQEAVEYLEVFHHYCQLGLYAQAFD